MSLLDKKTADANVSTTVDPSPLKEPLRPVEEKVEPQETELGIEPQTKPEPAPESDPKKDSQPSQDPPPPPQPTPPQPPPPTSRESNAGETDQDASKDDLEKDGAGEKEKPADPPATVTGDPAEPEAGPDLDVSGPTERAGESVKDKSEDQSAPSAPEPAEAATDSKPAEAADSSAEEPRGPYRAISGDIDPKLIQQLKPVSGERLVAMANDMYLLMENLRGVDKGEMSADAATQVGFLTNIGPLWLAGLERLVSRS